MFFDFIPCATGNRSLSMLRASCLTLEIKQLNFMRQGRQSNTGHLCQCSATEQWQPDNHQPSQSSICTAQVVLNPSGWCSSTLLLVRLETGLSMCDTFYFNLRSTGTITEPARLEGSESWPPVQLASTWVSLSCRISDSAELVIVSQVLLATSFISTTVQDWSWEEDSEPLTPVRQTWVS